MLLVECGIEYWEFVRKCRNDPKNSHGFIKNKFITKEMQCKYMSKYHNCFRISLLDGVPCGYVGVINNDIRICTQKKFQGKGVGKFMLSEASDIWPGAIGRVKKDNKASHALFISAGFKEIQRDNEFIFYAR